MSLASMFSLFLLCRFISYSNIATAVHYRPSPENSVQFKTPDLGLPIEIAHNLAQYSPFFPVAIYNPPPLGCSITQVNLLERHGARFPTASAGNKISKTIAKFANVTKFNDPKLEFLLNYTNTRLGTDDLVPFGAAQSYDSGQITAVRYAHLLIPQKEDTTPFVRASGSTRVVLSSTNFTKGLVHQFSILYPHLPLLDIVPPLILDEALNDTLDDSMCPAAVGSDAQDLQWQTTFAPPITARLDDGAPGANLTDDDVLNLMQLCSFDTVAFERKSAFCDIFQISEWDLFEYSGDVDKFYNTGYGNRLGPVQGVGYVNELLARMTNTPVNDSTQTNRTLDSDPATFPLNRTVYLDFTHDNQMIAIYAAIGLFPQATPLPLDDVNAARQPHTWLASHLVPFSARMVTEKLECSSTERKGEFVRILVSDEVQQMEFCQADGDGLCHLEAFVESQGYARQNGRGDFEKCFD